MDITRRQLTKIAREAQRYTTRILRGDGLGTSEYEFVHAVRKNPGITQAGVQELLALDRGAAARRAANLEKKGYLIRRPNPNDGRSKQLFATERADALKNSRASLEASFYEWLLAGLGEEERVAFAATLEKLYQRARAEREASFSHLAPGESR